MLVAFWLLFVALFVAVVALAWRPQRPAPLVALVGWLVYTGLLSASGWLARVDVRPPAFLFVAPGIVAWVLVAARTKAAKEVLGSGASPGRDGQVLGSGASPGRDGQVLGSGASPGRDGQVLGSGASPGRDGQIAGQVPVVAWMAMQVFRFPLELLLHALWKARLLPQMMTYEGANFDIVMGLSAPIVGYLALRGKISRKFMVLWNVVGIVLVVHVAARGVLTTPAIAALASDVPNHAIGMFPYTFIATFFVPAALVFHTLALRKLADPAPII